MYIDRDPEAEAEEKVEEDKLPGVEEEGAVAIESGFNAGGDWEAAAPGFAGATTGGEWGDAPAAPNWDAAGGGEWSAEAPKEAAPTQW
jgi:small subunit ribosomal protein SAe